MTATTPHNARVTPLEYKLSDLDAPAPPSGWYDRAAWVLRGGDGGEHGILLYKLVRRLSPDRSHALLDVGTARGFSAIAMSRALLDANLTGSVHTIDIIDHSQPVNWHSDTEGKQHPDEPLANEIISRSEIWSRWFPDEAEPVSPITATSHQVLRDWNDGPISLAFLDGSHTYEAVIEELRLLDPLLSEDGLIVLDDYHTGESAARINSRAVNLAGWMTGRALGKIWPAANLLAPRLGAQNEYIIVKRRYSGIARAVADFLQERQPSWNLEIVPMPSRGEYQGNDYSLAILTRVSSQPNLQYDKLYLRIANTLEG